MEPFNKPYKVFWGSPDPWVRKRLNLNLLDLQRQLNLLLLLFDEIVLSPSFILESSDLRYLLDKNALLLESNIVKFNFASPNHNLREYVAIKSKEHIGDIPVIIRKKYSKLTPNYKDLKYERIAKEYEPHISKNPREKELPSRITTLILSDFLPDFESEEIKRKFGQLLSQLIDNAPYYTKYIFLNALKIINVNDALMLNAIDKSTQVFFIASALGSGSMASLSWPNEVLPNAYRHFGLLGNLPLIVGIFNKILKIDNYTLSKLDAKSILKIRAIEERDIFQRLFFKTIFEVEKEPFSTIVLKLLRKSYKQEVLYKLFNKVDSSIVTAIISGLIGILSHYYGVSPIKSIIFSVMPQIIAPITRDILRQKKPVYPLNRIRELCFSAASSIEEYEQIGRNLNKIVQGITNG